MYQPEKKIDLANNIKFVYKVLLYSGLIPFKYTVSEKRCKHYMFNRILSQIVYRVLTLFYGVLVWWSFCTVLSFYINFIDPPNMEPGDSLDLDPNLQLCLVALRIVSTYIFASNYLSRGRCLLPVINEMLDIFHRLAAHTDSLVYFDSSFLPLGIMKIIFVAVRMQHEFTDLQPAAHVLREVLLPYSYLLCIMMSVSCICFQLTLICFYKKMTEFLALSCGWRANREVSQYIRRFIAISNRIHRIKKTLDCFYTILFIGTYIGMFSDIYYAYCLMRTYIFMMKEGASLFAILSTIAYSPVCVTATYDIYLLGRLSDMLAQSVEEFKRRVMDLIDERALQCRKHLQRTVELMLHQDCLRRIHTLAFEKFHFDPKFAFEYFLNVIVINVITCLQYYASYGINKQRT